MDAAKELLSHLDNLHTTEMGVDRIRRNLALDTQDVVAWCRDRILAADCRIDRRGKNWYAETDDCVITINAHSDTIITAHKTHKI